MSVLHNKAMLNPDGTPVGGGWSSSISWVDRERLRKIVRKVHLRNVPEHMLTNAECDKLIDAWGPITGESVIKQAMERGL